MKATVDLMPVSTERNSAEEKLDEAAENLAFAEAELAKALGYKLCQCTFPPQIMLSKGRHERGDEVFRCNKCGKQEPSEQHFALQERVDAHNQGRRSWIDARRRR